MKLRRMSPITGGAAPPSPAKVKSAKKRGPAGETDSAASRKKSIAGGTRQRTVLDSTDVEEPTMPVTLIPAAAPPSPTIPSTVATPPLRPLSTTEILQRAVRGATMLPPPHAAPAVRTTDGADEGAEYADPSVLLNAAHDYFKTFNRDERLRLQEANRRLHEMKRINRKGGDKDGFKFVVPKSAKQLADQMAQGIIHGKTLESSFGGDGLSDSIAPPVRKQGKRKFAKDDFYQFQVFKKWTRNAEQFLQRGHMSRSVLQVNKRTTRSL